jgi:hypothetical protein
MVKSGSDTPGFAAISRAGAPLSQDIRQTLPFCQELVSVDKIVHEQRMGGYCVSFSARSSLR